jgi:hypothetical protein
MLTAADHDVDLNSNTIYVHVYEHACRPGMGPYAAPGAHMHAPATLQYYKININRYRSRYAYVSIDIDIDLYRYPQLQRDRDRDRETAAADIDRY